MFNVILMLLPRAAITYPLYLLSVVSLFRFGSKKFIHLMVILAWCTVCFASLSLIYNLSVTAFILEIALVAPLLFLIIGMDIKVARPQQLLRALSLGILFLSLINLIFNYGFPLNLPYVDFLPDAYGALFGLGGAKIVTVLSFFCVLSELFGKSRSSFFLFVGLFNFLFPSYLLGIACGFFSLIFYFLRSLRGIALAMIITSLIFSYSFDRFVSIDSTIFDLYGMSPKVYAYFAVLNLFESEPVTVLLGTGLGQFSGTAALWASDYLATIGTQSIPNLPGFHMSYFHIEYLGEVLMLGSDNIWALSSSANKPYASISTILAEFGLIFGLLLIYYILRVIYKSSNLPIEKFVLSAFVFTILGVDVWHDNPWFLFGLVLILSVFREKRSLSEA